MERKGERNGGDPPNGQTEPRSEHTIVSAQYQQRNDIQPPAWSNTKRKLRHINRIPQKVIHGFEVVKV